MEINETTLSPVFSSILAEMGISSPVEKIAIEGLMDTPGHHWSNPGVKLITAHTSGGCNSFVLKTLDDHSKREIPVFRYLSGIGNFPIPRLFYTVYDDELKEYWIIMEKCDGRDFLEPAGFWEECGVLLARIHAAFWCQTDSLPDIFRVETNVNKYRDAYRTLMNFLDTLSSEDTAQLERELDISIINLRFTVEGLDITRIPDSPVIPNCLLHGAFHSPEIMWRKTHSGYLPLAVDWERSRAGVPAEDLEFAGYNLLAKDKGALFQLFLNTYLIELGKHGITLDMKELSVSVRHEAYTKQAGSVIPFLLKTYQEVSNDNSYASWCRWLKQEIPLVIKFVQNGIESSCVYSVE